MTTLCFTHTFDTIHTYFIQSFKKIMLEFDLWTRINEGCTPLTIYVHPPKKPVLRKNEKLSHCRLIRKVKNLNIYVSLMFNKLEPAFGSRGGGRGTPTPLHYASGNKCLFTLWSYLRECGEQYPQSFASLFYLSVLDLLYLTIMNLQSRLQW